MSTQCWLLISDDVDDLDAYAGQALSDSSKKSTYVARNMYFHKSSVYGGVLLKIRNRHIGGKLIARDLCISLPLLSVKEATELDRRRIDHDSVTSPAGVEHLTL